MSEGCIIAIGDIHGELKKLKHLFSKLSIKKEDTIVFLGDYIDRGPDSKGVIDFILSLEGECNLVTLKGNHEMFAMDSYKGIMGPDAWDSNRRVGYKMFQSWMMNGGRACLESYDKRAVMEDLPYKALCTMFETHGKFFRNLKLTYETENFIFVHGHLAHEQDVEDQEEWSCLWNGFRDIWPHKSGKTVVCGHSVQHSGPNNQGFKICIDTGSFLPQGYITAMVIDGPKMKFVDSRII